MLTASQEFDRLKEGESVYKLVGPVLLKQDKFEAESTVKGRLEFIGNEMCVPYPLSLSYFPSLALRLTFLYPPGSCVLVPLHSHSPTLSFTRLSAFPAPSLRSSRPDPPPPQHRPRLIQCRERVETQVAELQKKIEAKRGEIMQIQAAAQAAQQPPPQKEVEADAGI